jgi:hypothetical protein
MDPIDTYIIGKRIELSNSIQNCKIVYLDTNYWIKLRDQDKSTNSQDKALLNKVIELVESNKCIFPISEITFWEIFKQGDISTLLQSTKLIDKLSKGMSIVNDKERKHIEFAHFFRQKQGKEVYELNQLVWTKLAFTVLYHLLPRSTLIDIQKLFIDFIANYSFTDIVTDLDKSGTRIPFIFKDNVDYLNANKEKHKHENKSFKQMHLTELGGYIDAFRKDISETMEYLYFFDKGVFPTKQEKQEVDTAPLGNMIYNLTKFNKLTTELPSFRIVPELFAAARWNQDRKHKENDTMDFLHAAAALPYYDFFFTEHDLRTMIAQRKLDIEYNCVVESDPNKVLEILESI